MDYLEYLKTAEKFEMMPADLRKWVRWSINEIEKLREMYQDQGDALDEMIGIKEHLEGCVGPLRERVDMLEGLLANVHDELHDPMSQFWCDRPAEDRELLEALRGRIDEAMGWEECGTCKGARKIPDAVATRNVLDTIDGSGSYAGDCFGVDYTVYIPCPDCRKERK